MNESKTAKLIVALDVEELGDALTIVEKLRGLDVIFKLGYESLYGYGEALRPKLEEFGVPVFIDAKLHDIPRTVEAASSGSWLAALPPSSPG